LNYSEKPKCSFCAGFFILCAGERERLAATAAELNARFESSEQIAHKMLATQIDFFVESTNLTETTDGPPVDADAAFWQEHFDYETLLDFVSKIGEVMSGPLARRGQL
jgi:hypothetical protein